MVRKVLTRQEEFDIMKLVLDKFLWMGTFFLVLGLYVLFTKTVQEGAVFLGTGIIIFLLFSWIIIKEYEFIKYFP